jgi:hypothetical protein
MYSSVGSRTKFLPGLRGVRETSGASATTDKVSLLAAGPAAVIASRNTTGTMQGVVVQSIIKGYVMISKIQVCMVL